MSRDEPRPSSPDVASVAAASRDTSMGTGGW